MRHFSLHSLLVVVMVSIVTITPSTAIRGSKVVVGYRSLQHAGSNVPEPKEAKDEIEKEDKLEKEEKPADKADKADKANKETDPKKSAKKDKKACKKAVENDSKKSKKGKRRARHLQTVNDNPAEVFEGDVSDVGYCSQGTLTAAQCANLASVSNDGKVMSLLTLELIHNDEKHPQTMAEEAEKILNSGDTESRFVGCTNMDAPPSLTTNENTRRQRRTRRSMQSHPHRMLPTDDHDVIFKAEEDKIVVTGVDFRNLEIVRGGCKNADAPEGSVCDVLRSNADIFYKSGDGQYPTDEDREDMHNLLVETIMRQAEAGAFGNLGSVESLEIENGSGFGGSDTNGGEGTNLIPVIFGVLAALVIAGSVYWFCFRNVGGSEERHKGQNDDTSDEEHSDEDEEKRQRQVIIPEAQVVAVEEPGDKNEEEKKGKQGWW